MFIYTYKHLCLNFNTGARRDAHADTYILLDYFAFI